MNSFRRRITAFFVAVTLCFQGHFVDAAPLPAPDSTAALTPRPPIKLLEVSIPETMGTIKEKFEGQGKKVVFIIQDAHAIPDAQRSIQKLIEHFVEKYQVPLVALEGAASDLDPLLFKTFPDQELLRKVLEDYFDRGELAGGTAAAILNKSPAHYHGIENWELYEEGLKNFLEAMKVEPELSKKVEGRRWKVEGEKKKIYSEKLLEIDQKLEAFRRNETDLVSVMKALAAIKRPSLAKACWRSKVGGGGSKEELRPIFPSTVDLPPREALARPNPPRPRRKRQNREGRGVYEVHR